MPAVPRITQVVLLDHRCDGVVDCEDGTDEEMCDCRTRLEGMYSASAVCDGVADCRDGSDEKDCVSFKCKSDETVCGRPKRCVKKAAWCDGVVDCGGGDGADEKYCSKCETPRRDWSSAFGRGMGTFRF